MSIVRTDKSPIAADGIFKQLTGGLLAQNPADPAFVTIKLMERIRSGILRASSEEDRSGLVL
jgi:hypothetical protein